MEKFRKFSEREGRQSVIVQVRVVQIHGADAAVFIGGVVINAFVSIAAAGIQCYLRCTVLQQYTAFWQSYALEHVEEATHMILLIAFADGMTFEISGLDEPGHRGIIARKSNCSLSGAVGRDVFAPKSRLGGRLSKDAKSDRRCI